MIINEAEWRVMGISRSGNHAIINWLLAQTGGRMCFLNCVEPKNNPFCWPRPLASGLPYQVNYADFDLDQERRGVFSKKDYLIYSHEDCFLGLLRDGPWEQCHDAWVGPSALRRDLLILRDPFNLIASRIQSGIGAPPSLALRMWKQHARQFLGERLYLPRPPVRISYNAWVQQKSYRQRVAEDLGLRFSDAAFQDVPATAGGSSFDGLSFHGSASEMKVLDRWRKFADQDNFWRFFDREVVRLARAIFGPLPAIRWILRKSPTMLSAPRPMLRTSLAAAPGQPRLSDGSESLE
jgi:hypothetical protein